jgi:hypothetical protein
MKSSLCWLTIFGDLLRLFVLALRSKSSLAAENLFLRKQLAFYRERKIKPRRTDNPTRLTLVWLSRWFDWRNALAMVTPKTFSDESNRSAVRHMHSAKVNGPRLGDHECPLPVRAWCRRARTQHRDL